MTDRIKLTDAIKGNETGVARMAEERDCLRRKASELIQRADDLHREIQARRKMAEAMQELQNLMPPDETIAFLVPDER